MVGVEAFGIGIKCRTADGGFVKMAQCGFD
jgi:hypothetical protein